MRAGTADISVPASGAARQNRLVMAVAAVALWLFDTLASLGVQTLIDLV